MLGQILFGAGSRVGTERDRRLRKTVRERQREGGLSVGSPPGAPDLTHSIATEPVLPAMPGHNGTPNATNCVWGPAKAIKTVESYPEDSGILPQAVTYQRKPRPTV
jgi:hypothetical protein